MFEHELVSRRSFFKLGGAGAAAAYAAAKSPATWAAEAAATEQKMTPKIGVQLYSVRDDCSKDLPGTITKVGKMGYTGVEFAGYYNRTAKDLRKLLDDSGLVCCGTHIGLNTMQGDALKATVEFNKTLGNKNLICPGVQAKTRDDWLGMAKQFNDIADKLKPDGMRTGYHNHGAEFEPFPDGDKPWDVFFANTKKEVIMQFDVGNAMPKGEAVFYLKKFPGRAVTMHVKPWSKTNRRALIGEDDLPWKEIFTLAETTGNTEWYIVEYEVPGTPAIEAIDKCLQALKKMGK